MLQAHTEISNKHGKILLIEVAQPADQLQLPHQGQGQPLWHGHILGPKIYDTDRTGSTTSAAYWLLTNIEPLTT